MCQARFEAFWYIISFIISAALRYGRAELGCLRNLRMEACLAGQREAPHISELEADSLCSFISATLLLLLFIKTPFIR